jgi:CheY-like chemotaxis protein
MASEHRRVLIVDDDHDVRRILAVAVRQRGLTIDEAANGHEAIELLRQHAYAVVLLDILMPGADGFAVLDALREQSMHAPVVLVVSGAERNVLDRLDARRIHGVVRKPFDPHELAGVVTACAEIRGLNALETMALAVVSGAPLFALLHKL